VMDMDASVNEFGIGRPGRRAIQRAKANAN
jgi:hypothetical protein